MSNYTQQQFSLGEGNWGIKLITGEWVAVSRLPHLPIRTCPGCGQVITVWLFEEEVWDAGWDVAADVEQV